MKDISNILATSDCHSPEFLIVFDVFKSVYEFLYEISFSSADASVEAEKIKSAVDRAISQMSDNEIERLAKHLWEVAGKPQGKDLEIWLAAEKAFNEKIAKVEEVVSSHPLIELAEAAKLAYPFNPLN